MGVSIMKKGVFPPLRIPGAWTRLLRKKRVIIPMAAILVLASVLYGVQRSMLFLASPFAFVPELWGLGEMEVVSYQSYDGTELSAWYRPPEREGGPVIMYLPGARGHLGWEGYRMKPYLEAGYGVFMMGYRGYGTNPGRPGEYAFYNDATRATRFLMSRGHRPDDIVIYGYSLGTAVAIELATRFKGVAGVVLEAPLASISGILRQHYLYVPDFLIRFRFNSRAKIAYVVAPIFILHGTEDEVVTMRHSELLYRSSKTCAGMLIIKDGDHRNLSELGGDEQVRSFINAVANPDGGKQSVSCPFCSDRESPTLWERCQPIQRERQASAAGRIASGSPMPASCATAPQASAKVTDNRVRRDERSGSHRLSPG